MLLYVICQGKPSTSSTSDSCRVNNSRQSTYGCAGFWASLQVLSIPSDMAYGGRGPLLSARLVDLDMMWTRAEQVEGLLQVH